MERLAVFGSSYIKRMGNAMMNINVLGSTVSFFGVPCLGVSAVLTHLRLEELKGFSPTQFFLNVGAGGIPSTQ